MPPRTNEHLAGLSGYPRGGEITFVPLSRKGEIVFVAGVGGRVGVFSFWVIVGHLSSLQEGDWLFRLSV